MIRSIIRIQFKKIYTLISGIQNPESLKTKKKSKSVLAEFWRLPDRIGIGRSK